MGVILDTSILIALERGLIDIDKLIADKGDQPFGISVITASELLHIYAKIWQTKEYFWQEALIGMP